MVLMNMISISQKNIAMYKLKIKDPFILIYPMAILVGIIFIIAVYLFFKEINKKE